MQQFRRLREGWCYWLRLLLLLQTVESLRGQFTANNLQDADTTATVTARRTPTPAPYPTYFFMDLNGSYKYAFDTGNGIASEQSANQANEVTGQYSYYENGVPYMVKYKAGVQGYQAEIIPTAMQQGSAKNIFETNLFANSEQKSPQLTQQQPNIKTVERELVQLSPANDPAILQTSSNVLADNNINTAALGTNISNDGGGAGVESGTVSTLQFVQDAMQMMRNSPLQLSFTSQQGFGLPAGNSGSFRILPQSIGPAPVTTDEIQQINALAEHGLTNTVAAVTSNPELRRQPYEFSYLSQQSSRSESADKSGNVVGKYSYYDDAGFHDLTYKAGDDIGFVVLGGSLADRRDRLASAEQRSTQSPLSTAAIDSISPNDPAFLIVNVSQQPNVNYNYRVVADPPVDRRTRRNSHSVASAVNTLNSNNNNNFNTKPHNNRRSLRKFQRNANW